MASDTPTIRRFLADTHPFDLLSERALTQAATAAEPVAAVLGQTFWRSGESVPGLMAIEHGAVEILSPEGTRLSRLGSGDVFGERGLMRDGLAPNTAVATEPAALYCLPPKTFHALLESEPGFARFFGRTPAPDAVPAHQGDLSMLGIEALMSAGPVTAAPDLSVAETAQLMSARAISCVLIVDEGRLAGLVTASDLCARVLAEGRAPETPIAAVMTPMPLALEAGSLGLDALRTMVERRIGHLPVVEQGRPVGIVTRTDLIGHQALSAPALHTDIVRAETDDALAAVTARVPRYLAQLVGTGAEPPVVTRLVTDVTDALTRRLIALAEAELGPAPVPYLWAVCGSQGRREQTGTSDQDNCLILDDTFRESDRPYFEALARRVSDGLDHCGFVYCPGAMMATNPRWCQPLATWRRYFRGWIDKPDPEAQLLASVMFDLRAIAGETALLEGLQAETLAAARKNSIFVSHMIRNALTHTPPLGLFRGFALIRSGEHKNALDLKLNGVVPVVDLGRVYALMGALSPVGTRARLVAAIEAGVVSETGGRDLLDAYDLIAEARLDHQAAQVRRGQKPDNFLAPATLSDLERNHLKDAFVVVRTMQAALGQGRHTLA